MPFANLEKFEREKRARERVEALEEKERVEKQRIRAAVKSLLPARVPKRGRGRSPSGGVSRKEVAQMARKAEAYLGTAAGLREFEAEALKTALVILLIDGVLGTQPWRNQGGHGPLISAQARVRYLENAARLLADLRERTGGDDTKLLEGVLVETPQ